MRLWFRKKTVETRRIRMLKSVAGPEGEFVAGEKYRIPVDVADRFVARGYAKGKLSRSFTEAELLILRGNSQVVTLGQ